jgi:hypothetical protein
LRAIEIAAICPYPALAEGRFGFEFLPVVPAFSERGNPPKYACGNRRRALAGFPCASGQGEKPLRANCHPARRPAGRLKAV